MDGGWEMPIASMTGFGRSAGIVESYAVTVEMKSVNHRFAEYSVRTPREWSFLEEDIRRRLTSAIARGRVDVFLNVERTEHAVQGVNVNWQLLDALVAAEAQMSERYGVTFEPSQSRTWLMYPDVLIPMQETLDEHAIQLGVGRLVDEAIGTLVEMRRTEGARLAANCLEKIGELAEYVARLREREKLVVESKRDRLEKRLRELGVSFDDQRLEQEIVLLVDKSAIDEEVVRLQSHLESFREALEGSGSIGRRLDFIVQEMHREVNTIGSKSSDAEVSRSVVDMKVLVEQLREQVQNIE